LCRPREPGGEALGRPVEEQAERFVERFVGARTLRLCCYAPGILWRLDPIMRSFAAFALALGAAPLWGQSLLFEFHGNQVQGQQGSSFCAVPDLDDDGHDELLVATPRSFGSRDVRILSGRDGSVLRTHAAPSGSDWHGHVVAAGVDLDGDQVPDYGIADPYADARAGRIWLYSGKDGSLLFSEGGSAGEMLGYCFGLIEDLDGDKQGEFWAGAPRGGVAGAGRFEIWSGKTGLSIREHVASSGTDYGQYACAGGDADGDGVGDYLIVRPGILRPGSAELRSGATGSLLRSFSGAASDDWFGAASCFLPDLDGDGADELVIAAPRASSAAGELRIHSGKKGSVLRTLKGSEAGDHFGWSVAAAGELDGDKKGELIVGAPFAQDLKVAVGKVVVYRGAWLESGSGTEMFASYLGTHAADQAGRAVGSAGDMDGDGEADFAYGVSGDDLAASNGGRLCVVSSVDKALTCDQHELSLSAGGLAKFQLDAGPSNADDLYLLLGSATGTAPGVQLGRITLPLELDAYSLLLLGAPNSLLVPNLSVLDSKGQATAAFLVPPGSPVSLVGLRLDHAYLLIEINGNDFEFASNPVPLRFVR
jgi:hypothetical protein